MTEEIIINGVNVAGCKNYCVVLKDMCAFGGTKRCSQIHNCYYKQLKRLEQENKELKEDVLKWQKAFSRQYQINENKGYSKVEESYRSALEEINLILDELKQQYDYMTDYSEIKEIQDKINGVLQ